MEAWGFGGDEAPVIEPKKIVDYSRREVPFDKIAGNVASYLALSAFCLSP